MTVIFKALRTAAALAFFTAASTPGIALGQDGSAIRLGTSGLGSPYYIVGVGMSEIIQKHTPVRVSVETVGGSVATLFALATGRLELGMATSYNVLLAYRGERPFKAPAAVSLIAQGQKTYRILLVRKGAGITKPEDFIGKRVIGKRPALADLELVTNAFLKVHGIRRDQVKIISTTTTNEAYAALRAGTADAAFVPGSPRSAVLQSAFNDDAVSFFHIAHDKAQAMLKELPPSFALATFPAKLFKGETRDPYTFALTTYLVTRNDIPENTVYQVTKAVLSNVKELKTYHAQGATWTVKASLSSPVIPFHPGAIRYYREIGAWTPQLDALQTRNRH